MKKRFLALGIALCMSFTLIGCSDNGTKVESEKSVAEETEEETTTTAADDSDVGEIVEENGIRKEPVITDKDLNREGESGSIKYNLTAVQVSKLTATTEEMATLLDIEQDKEYALVVFDIEVENTSEDTISFYSDLAQITTNTKEQIDADSWLTDDVGGDFKGEVKKEGSIYFILKNSSAEDIDEITLYIDGASDENFETVGEDVEEKFTFE